MPKQTISVHGSLERLDARAEVVRRLMSEGNISQINEFWQQLDLSSIYHDCALEGQVVSLPELRAVFESMVVADAASLPLTLCLRSHKQALVFGRDLAQRKNILINTRVVKQYHEMFATDPEDGRTGEYRSESPLHRSYFHEICDPAAIPVEMRKLFAWVEETADDCGGEHPVRYAAKFHMRFMRIFPFTETAGKIGRNLVNVILVHHGYLPAIIHATERQRYYEAIRQSVDALTVLIAESSAASFEAAAKFFSRTACA